MHGIDKLAFILELVVIAQSQRFIEVFTIRQIKMCHSQTKANFNPCRIFITLMHTFCCIGQNIVQMEMQSRG